MGRVGGQEGKGKEEEREEGKSDAEGGIGDEGSDQGSLLYYRRYQESGGQGFCGGFTGSRFIYNCAGDKEIDAMDACVASLSICRVQQNRLRVDMGDAEYLIRIDQQDRGAGKVFSSPSDGEGIDDNTPHVLDLAVRLLAHLPAHGGRAQHVALGLLGHRDIRELHPVLEHRLVGCFHLHEHLIQCTPIVVHAHVLVADDLVFAEFSQEHSELGFPHVGAHLMNVELPSGCECKFRSVPVASGAHAKVRVHALHVHDMRDGS